MNSNSNIIANSVAIAAAGGVFVVFARYEPDALGNLVSAIVIAILSLAAVVAIRHWILDAMKRREVDARGFEVKLITGEPPVAQKDTNL